MYNIIYHILHTILYIILYIIYIIYIIYTSGLIERPILMNSSRSKAARIHDGDVGCRAACGGQGYTQHDILLLAHCSQILVLQEAEDRDDLASRQGYTHSSRRFTTRASYGKGHAKFRGWAHSSCVPRALGILPLARRQLLRQPQQGCSLHGLACLFSLSQPAKDLLDPV